MPELPEVETIKNQLSEHLPLEIESWDLSDVSTSILKDKDKNFDLQGLVIEKIGRHGKMMKFYLSDEKFIASHLGMSGSWHIWKEQKDVKHAHIKIKGKNVWFVYVDPRRFGSMYLFDAEQMEKYESKLGIDIASPEFTADYILTVLKKYPDRKLKPFLLDQKYFAGVGNYIACEICALAGIRPTRRAGKVTKAESEKIRKAAVEVIEGQVKSNGLTFSGGYTDAYGEKGEGVSNLVVFHQKTCGMCDKEIIKKIVLAQRGTYYCPECQK